jgi:hypothetical protein
LIVLVGTCPLITTKSSFEKEFRTRDPMVLVSEIFQNPRIFGSKFIKRTIAYWASTSRCNKFNVALGLM